MSWPEVKTGDQVRATLGENVLVGTVAHTDHNHIALDLGGRALRQTVLARKEERDE